MPADSERSTATRLAQFATFGYVVAQGLLASFYGINTALSDASAMVSLASVLLALFLVTWASFNIHGPLVPPRRLAFVGAAGAALRLVALPPAGLPVPWAHKMPATGYVLLIVGYALLFFAFFGAVRDTARRVPIRIPLMLSVGGGAVAWMLMNYAAFGPLPGVRTILTPRDVLAIYLMAADVALAVMTCAIALASLRFENGVLSVSWLSVAYGLAVAAMGDSVQPLLKVDEAAMFSGLLWGLGYLLVALGFCMMRDSVVWNESRRGEQAPLLVHLPREIDRQQTFWERLSEHSSTRPNADPKEIPEG